MPSLFADYIDLLLLSKSKSASLICRRGRGRSVTSGMLTDADRLSSLSVWILNEVGVNFSLQVWMASLGVVLTIPIS